MNYNGEEYFYLRNLQQDIIALIDISGTIKVNYEYDAWGNIINITDNSGTNLGEINPYRYRGYRYDEETGWYYLNSRYYNPEISRFINADGLIGKTGDILGHNLYSYCQNSPVMMVDPSGYWPKWLKATITVAAVVGVVALAVGVSVATGGAGSVAATIAITYAINTIANMTTVGVAQYHKSKADGDTGGEIYDDVVDAVFSTTDDILLQNAGMKTAMPALTNTKTTGVTALFSSTYKMDVALNGKSFGQLALTSVKNNLTSKPLQSSSTLSRAGFYFAYTSSAYNVSKTVRSFFDEDYSYDQAQKLGWDPR